MTFDPYVRHGSGQWRFTLESLCSSGALLDATNAAASAAADAGARLSACAFIDRVALRLRGLPCETVAVAKVFLLRFAVRHVVARNIQNSVHPYVAGATALFLACKSTDHYKKLANLIYQCRWVAFRPPEGTPDSEFIIRPEFKDSDPEYKQWYDNIIATEEHMTSALCFDLVVQLPHEIVIDLLEICFEPIRLSETDEEIELRTEIYQKLRHHALHYSNECMATTLPLRYNRNLLALIILRVAVEATKKSFAKRTVPTRVAEFLNNLLIIPPLTDTLRSIFHVPDFFEVEMMRYRGLKRDYEGIFGGVGCLESAEVRGEELAKVLLNAGMEIMLVGNRPKYEKYIGELYGPVITRMQQLRKQHLAAKKSNSPSPAVIAPARPMPTKSSSPSSPAVVSNAQLSSSTSSKPVTNSQLPRSSSSIHSLPPKPVVPSPSIPIPTSSTQQSSGDNRFHPYAKPPSSSYSNSNYSSQQRPSSSGSSYKSNGSSDRYSNQRDRDSHYRGPPPPSSTSTGATYQKPGNPPPVPPLPGWYPPQSQPHGRNPVVPLLPHHAFVPPLPGGPLPPAPPPPPL